MNCFGKNKQRLSNYYQKLKIGIQSAYKWILGVVEFIKGSKKITPLRPLNCIRGQKCIPVEWLLAFL